ncbi:hypothetical protein [Thalassotalea sp. G2M2-11]|uniref:hypothetical protein n=1 Tax=Thalassotalea sp. G2M2-11 TaxID=2787627 RepID=UPI0019D23EA9|nr:hypothetical protein [Thalassotalea sp. G2M2-11]
MKYVIGITTLLFCLNLNAASINSQEQTKEICGNAVEKFSKNKVSESFDSLRPFWPLPKAELDNLSYQTKSQLDMVSGRFGRILGSDFIKSQIAGTSFVQHTYAIKFEKHALRFVCLFYKPENKWVVNSVYWDDKTTLFFN